MAALSLAVMAAVGSASRLGFGWIFTLGTANVVRSWMSPPTLIALGTGQVGILLGLGDHTTAVLSLTRGIGVLDHRGDGRAGCCWPCCAAGCIRSAGSASRWVCAVLLFPVVQPWYLLWAIIPLAAWATRPGFRDRGDHRDDGRRRLRPHGQRRPVRAVPDRGRHAWPAPSSWRC